MIRHLLIALAALLAPLFASDEDQIRLGIGNVPSAAQKTGLGAWCGVGLGDPSTPVAEDTANSLGASATVLNTATATFTRTTSAYDPVADAIVGANVRRTRSQVIGTTTYSMDLIETQRNCLLATGTGERFDRWTAANGLTVAADTTAAPNGEVIAQTLTDPGGSLSSAEQTFTVTNDSLLHEFSIYVLKTAGGTAPTFGVTLALSGGTPVTTNARINTDTGTQAYGSNASTSIVNADATYWRVIVIIANNTSGNTTLTLDVYPAAAAYGASVDAAAATGSAICTFADLNKSGASATSFFAASFTGCRNCMNASEVLDNAAWTKTRSSISANTTANPLDAGVTADTIVEDSTATNTHFITQSFTKSAAAIQFTYSTYLLQSGRTWAFVQCSDNAAVTTGNGIGLYVNLGTGAAGSTVSVGAGWTLDSSHITAVGSWYRVDITVTSNTATTIRPKVCAATGDNGNSYTGTGINSLICWGNQLVYGAKPKTYWATFGAGVRAADVLTSATTISTTTGTVIAVARPYGWSTDQDGVSIFRLFVSTGTSADCTVQRNGVGGLTLQRSDAGGAENITDATVTWANGANNTVGMTWNASAINAYVNGATSGTPDTTLSAPYNAVPGIGIGATTATTNNMFNGYVVTLYWSTVLAPSADAIFANGVAP